MIDEPLKEGQVRQVDFEYEEDPTMSKERPAVVALLREENDDVLLVKITSHGPRKESPGEVVIKDWKEAGLKHKSTARCSKTMIAKAKDIEGSELRGSLSEPDFEAVKLGLVIAQKLR